LNISRHQQNKSLHQCQAQSGSSKPTVDRRIGLRKRRKEERDFGSGNSDTGVSDGEFDSTFELIVLLYFNGHVAARLGEFDGVSDDVLSETN
jgi:hypothetical protein